MTCECLRATADLDEVRDLDGSIPLVEFIEIRKQCPALREILLPDIIWQKVLNRLGTDDSVAAHTSIFLLAFRRGCLSAVTEPIHRFLLTESGIIDPRIRRQYLEDLQEKWLLAPDPVRRHSLCRIYRGRLLELQFARRLEACGETVIALEAWREGADIQTELPLDGSVHTYEVKFVGLEDTDFALLPAERAASISSYVAPNYLLFRIYEAAKQLESADGCRHAIVVLDEQTWRLRLKQPLEDEWIAKNSFCLFPVAEDKWNQFILKQQKRYLSLPDDMSASITTLNNVEIFRQLHDFQFIQVWSRSRACSAAAV